MKLAMRLVLIILCIFSTNCFANSENKNLSIIACESKECKKQFIQVKKLAKNGSPDAQGVLSSMYLNGYGTKIDKSRGMRWIKKSAKNGGNFYRNKLGMMYLTGEHLEKNIEKGLSLLQKSAKNDNAQAYYFLGSMYANGINLEKDFAKAHENLLNAAKLGNDDAMMLLGYLYENGAYGAGRLDQAKEFYKAAAQRNNTYSIEKLIQIDPENYKVNVPNNDIETIIVRAPSVSELIDELVRSVKSSRMYSGGSQTGTRISGRSCLNTGECKVLGTNAISKSLFYGSINATFARIVPPAG